MFAKNNKVSCILLISRKINDLNGIMG